MSIREIFRTRADSQADLVKKYQNLQTEKAELELKAAELKESALDSDNFDDVAERLQKINIQIELCDSACDQVQQQLEKMLEKKIASDFEGLNEQRLEFQTRQADLAREAGTFLGQAINALQATDLPFATTLARYIREQVVEFSNDHRRKDQMIEFLIGYGDAINSQSDAINFRDWKKRIAKIEGLQPQSLESKRHIESKVKKLISA